MRPEAFFTPIRPTCGKASFVPVTQTRSSWNPKNVRGIVDTKKVHSERRNARMQIIQEMKILIIPQSSTFTSEQLSNFAFFLQLISVFKYKPW